MNKQPFRITAEEIRRYRQFNVPLPRTTYYERMIGREKLLGQLKLFTRICEKTGEEVLSRYSSESDRIVWKREEWEKEFRS